MGTIVGIDPGLAATGVGVVRGEGPRVTGYAFGCIRTPADAPAANRLHLIFSRLETLFAKEAPDAVVVEDVYSLPEYPRSAITLGQVTGVVMLAAARAGLPCLPIAVREAKLALTGNGGASKAQLAEAVRARLSHPGAIRPSHAADALGLALIGLLRGPLALRRMAMNPRRGPERADASRIPRGLFLGT
ncbi:MAG: crossover junction endodeoxyribonuclease RuvC [Desulfobacterales bacterium]